jgi:hypothetical protein
MSKGPDITSGPSLVTNPSRGRISIVAWLPLATAAGEEAAVSVTGVTGTWREGLEPCAHNLPVVLGAARLLGRVVVQT